MDTVMGFAMDCILAAIGAILMVTTLPSVLVKKKIGFQDFFVLTCITAYFLFAATNFVLSVIVIWGGYLNGW